MTSYLKEHAFWLFVLWMALLVYLFGKPPNTPPSAPAGVGLVHGFPFYAHPPVSYEDRFSPDALGPAPQSPYCPVARAAVTAQGVRE